MFRRLVANRNFVYSPYTERQQPLGRYTHWRRGCHEWGMAWPRQRAVS